MCVSSLAVISEWGGLTGFGEVRVCVRSGAYLHLCVGVYVCERNKSGVREQSFAFKAETVCSKGVATGIDWNLKATLLPTHIYTQIEVRLLYM